MLDEPQTSDQPWKDVETRYLPGQQVRGLVTRLTQFGMFVELEPGLEGVLYAFEVGTGPGALQHFARGQELQLYVKSIDVRKRRLELSFQNDRMPGLLEESALPADLLRPTNASMPGGQADRLAALPLGDAETRCQSCQRIVRVSWRYCVYCGGSLQRICLACRSVQPDLPDALYCWACGQLLGPSLT